MAIGIYGISRIVVCRFLKWKRAIRNAITFRPLRIKYARWRYGSESEQFASIATEGIDFNLVARMIYAHNCYLEIVKAANISWEKTKYIYLSSAVTSGVMMTDSDELLAAKLCSYPSLAEGRAGARRHVFDIMVECGDINPRQFAFTIGGQEKLNDFLNFEGEHPTVHI